MVIPLFSHTALSEKENLSWSGMDLCNVIQNEHVDEKDRFCIVGHYLDDTGKTGVHTLNEWQR